MSVRFRTTLTLNTHEKMKTIKSQIHEYNIFFKSNLVKVITF